MEEGDEPAWWLEGSFYPICILEPERVEVLLSSRELKAKYGQAPVAVTFRYGEDVFHMISHYFLQRTELRSTRHTTKASAFMDERGLELDARIPETIADLSPGEVVSDASSAGLFANLVAEKKQRVSEQRSSGGKPSQRSGGIEQHVQAVDLLKPRAHIALRGAASRVSDVRQDWASDAYPLPPALPQLA